MNIELIIGFAMLFGATIALICAMYVYLLARDERNRQIAEQAKKQD